MKSVSLGLCKIVFFITLFIVCTDCRAEVADYNGMSKSELQARIAALELGFDSYVIGRKLNDEQSRLAQKDNTYQAYPGTRKFKDGSLFVVIDAETDVVIAVYKREKEATREDYKAMVGALMMKYGEPTAEAHGKTIYWNYGEDGLISEELYRTAKSQGMLDTLVILATVKFSSSQHADTMTNMVKRMEETGSAAQSEQEILSDNYVMIQSDLLTKKYIQ